MGTGSVEIKLDAVFHVLINNFFMAEVPII